MDIFELQRRCHEVAGESEERAERRQERLRGLYRDEPKERRWMPRAEWEAYRADKALAYYAHVSEFEGRPKSPWKRRFKRK